MARTGWERFDSQDDGYYVEPLTLREDSDAGAVSHRARRAEQAKVVAFLRHYLEFDLAERIERGDHYAATPKPPPDVAKYS